MPRGVFERTLEHNAALSKALRNSAAVKAKADAQRGVPLSPEHCAALSEAMKNSKAAKAASKANIGVPLSPEHCAAISKGLTGVPFTPEHCAAISVGHRNSDAVKAKAEAQKGVPHSPERIAAIKTGLEESGVYDRMRGGHDICNHHYIYDHSDLSKYTIEMTRSQHQILHNQMQSLDIQVPHINTDYENAEELELMEYIKNVEKTEAFINQCNNQ